MAVLNTATGQRVLTKDEPYAIERLRNRYYFTAGTARGFAQIGSRRHPDTTLGSACLTSSLEQMYIW